MKVALVHYWLNTMRGGEKVLEALCELFPQADIYTHLLDPAAISPTLARHKISTTFINRMPLAKRAYKAYLPLMPMALEQLDLSGYDLIISSESGPAKGIIPPPGATHLCYCHSPMRYIWDMYAEYRRGNIVKRLAMAGLTNYLRMWDAASAMRVDRFAANSSLVSQRIRKYYRRDSTVIFPPVDTAAFAPGTARGDYYLYAGQLTAYKRPALAVEAFNRMGRKLIVAGQGEELVRIQKIAGPTVEVLGAVTFEQLRTLYAECRALIFPGCEDFGIVPLEAMASGKPVIAFGAGGALDTVKEGLTGLYFHEQTADALIDAVRAFERREDIFDPGLIRIHAEGFSKENFKSNFLAFAEEATGQNLSGGEKTPEPAENRSKRAA